MDVNPDTVGLPSAVSADEGLGGKDAAPMMMPLLQQECTNTDGKPKRNVVVSIVEKYVPLCYVVVIVITLLWFPPGECSNMFTGRCRFVGRNDNRRGQFCELI